jgi:Na+/proline symporter
MIGLLVAGLFAATMSSMDTGLNRNAGFLTKNFYAKLIRPQADDKELLRVGQILTALMGIIVIVIAMLLIGMGEISLFDIVLTIGSMLSIPIFVPLFLGIIFKGQPKWAAWTAVIVGFIISLLIEMGSHTELALSLFQSMGAEDLLLYTRSHTMTMNVLINIPLTTLWYLSTKYMPHKKDPEYTAQVDAFFTQMNTPVDFEKEVGAANDKDQAKVLGYLASVYGVFVLLLLFIPNSAAARWALFGCGGFMLGVGLLLIAYSKKPDLNLRAEAIDEALIPEAELD